MNLLILIIQVVEALGFAAHIHSIEPGKVYDCDAFTDQTVTIVVCQRENKVADLYIGK